MVAVWPDTYLYGIDLFNAQFYWEAHEVWESLWLVARRFDASLSELSASTGELRSGAGWEAHEAWEGLCRAAERRGTTARFLKALIKLAAAGVKHLEGKPVGVASHARRAAELWHEVAGPPVFLGLRIASLIALAESIARDGWPDAPPILWPSETD